MAPYWSGRGFGDTGEIDDVLVEAVLVVDVDGSLVRVVDDDGGGSFVSLLLARDLSWKMDEIRDLRVGLGSGGIVAILSSTDGEVKVGYVNEVCSRDDVEVERRSRKRGEAGLRCR
jgi:hypothetical protein